jgi:hypothetical protein
MTTTMPLHHLLDTLHQQVLGQRHHLDELISTWGTTPFQAWWTSLDAPWSCPLPTSDPLFDTVYQHTKRLLYREIASRLTSHLEHSPHILTANHHGLDCYAQTLQGTLLFALARFDPSAKTPSYFPVLACSNVSLNNLTYPQGILLARKIKTPSGRNTYRWVPAKIPVFPRRQQHALVSKLDAYTPAMLHKARSLARATTPGLLPSEQQAVLHLLDRIYPQALDHACFSDQCTVINTRAWPDMFSRELAPTFPCPVYLEMETICSRLMTADLTSTCSLMHTLLFDPPVRKELMHALDNAVGCWSLEGLNNLKDSGLPVHNQKVGTLFFWTVDHKGCKMPMHLVKSGPAHQLVPVRATPQTRGEAWTPTGIVHALEQGRILPSLFTCYATLALARGLVCHGGIYQTEYLPAMQAGVSRALDMKGHTRQDARVNAVCTNAMCAGHNLAMARYADKSIVPAGRIEFMAGGGITHHHLEQMGNLTLQHASLASLAETFAPFLPSRWQSREGYVELTNLVYQRLRHRLPCFTVN